MQKEKRIVEILNKKFEVIPSKGGSCDDCYFLNKQTCPPKALRNCIWGGNILKEIKENK